MPRKCVVRHCNSNLSGSPYTPTFTIPKDPSRWSLWKSKIRESTNISYLRIDVTDTVCIKHFEDKFIVRSSPQNVSEGKTKKPQRTKLSLTKDAFPTLDLVSTEGTNIPMNEDDFDELIPVTANQPMKPKRGSSGLANLQKARMRKLLRRERMKTMQNKKKSTTVVKIESKPAPVAVAKKTAIKPEIPTKLGKDYFLSERTLSDAEKLLIPLRLTSKCRGGSKVIKDQPSSIRDVASFPTFNIIQKIQLSDKNPVQWTVEETYRFVKFVAPIRGIAEFFKAEEIDGEILINLTENDLKNYFSMQSKTSTQLYETITQLKTEIIRRFINI